MATKFIQGIFTPTNPKKYCGNNLKKIIYRSSWEHSVMRFLDLHPSVVYWSSECISIPYIHPFLRNKNGSPRIAMYVPDFFVIYIDKNDKQFAEVMEVKPSKENPWSNPNGKYTPKLQGIRAVNAAKWSAAIVYCAKRHWKFRYVTEIDIFYHKP